MTHWWWIIGDYSVLNESCVQSRSIDDPTLSEFDEFEFPISKRSLKDCKKTSVTDLLSEISTSPVSKLIDDSLWLISTDHDSLWLTRTMWRQWIIIITDIIGGLYDNHPDSLKLLRLWMFKAKVTLTSNHITLAVVPVISVVPKYYI